MSTGQDHPDFLRSDQWVATPLVNALQVAMPNNTSFGPFYVGNWEALSFSIFQAGGAGTSFTVTFNFRATIGGPVVATVAYNAANGQLAIDCIPIQANYVTVTIGGWAGTRDFQVVVLPRRGFNPAARMDGGDALLYIPSTNIGSGVTTPFLLSHVTAAHCTFTIHTSAAVWSALINVLNLAGAVIGIVGNLGSAAGRAPGTIQVDLPPWPCRVDVSNFDAGVQVFFGGIVPLRSS